LRKETTLVEQILWDRLLGRRFQYLGGRRQHPLGRFIVDFYCAEHWLVIELDGVIHRHQQEYDQARTDALQSYGYRVLRFLSDAVFPRLDDLLEAIVSVVEQTPPPSPNPGRGKGLGDG
jgi:very-short-patch-repair endonuclease